MKRILIPTFGYNLPRSEDIRDMLLDSDWLSQSLASLLRDEITPEQFLLQMQIVCENRKDLQREEQAMERRTYCGAIL